MNPCIEVFCGNEIIFVVVQVEHYLQQYEWITTERKYFGQANTAYDFEANNPKEASRRLQKLQETKESLTKKVNMRAMNMLGKAEEQVRDECLHRHRDVTVCLCFIVVV